MRKVRREIVVSRVSCLVLIYEGDDGRYALLIWSIKVYLKMVYLFAIFSDFFN